MSALIHFLSKFFFGADRKKTVIPANPASCLIIRQHNQLGDMLATVPLFRAIKSKFPGIKLYVLASPDNFFALNKNCYVDRLFVFDKKKLFDFKYLKEFFGFLRLGYDITLVPGTVSISFTSCLLAGISSAKLKVGPAKLNGKKNEADYFFHIPVDLDWSKNPRQSVYRFILEVLEPFNVPESDIHGEVTFDSDDSGEAERFIEQNNLSRKYLVGLHVGAGKPPNVWNAGGFSSLINKLQEDLDVPVFLTGSNQDDIQIEQVQNGLKIRVPVYKNKSITSLAAMISKADLFISNDTGIMHVAGATQVPQISLFGPTDPDNWAAPGGNKINLRKSENIDDITVDEVYNTAVKILLKN